MLLAEIPSYKIAKLAAMMNFKVIESALCNIATYDMSTSVIDAKIVVERNPT